MRLRIESANGSLVNDYCIFDGRVQVRSLQPSGRPVPGSLGDWKLLDKNDIALHHALRTPVARWLRVRLRQEPSPLGKAA